MSSVSKTSDGSEEWVNVELPVTAEAKTPSAPVESQAIRVTVKTQAGAVFTIDTDRKCSGDELRRQICDCMGGSSKVVHLRMMLGNTALSEKRTLGDYGVVDGSTIRVVSRVRGGAGPAVGFEFADLKSYEGKKSVDSFVLEPTTLATAHLVVVPGLFGQGECTNVKCDWYKRHVICNKGLGVHNIGAVMNELQCPKCQQDVVPARFGISSCWWKFTGYKKRATAVGGPPMKDEKVQSPRYIIVPNGEYHYFADDPALQATYSTLIITAKVLKAKDKPGPKSDDESDDNPL